MKIEDFTPTGQALLRSGKGVGHEVAILEKDDKWRVLSTVMRSDLPHVRGLSDAQTKIDMETIEGL